jgi:hypothetical protein
MLIGIVGNTHRNFRQRMDLKHSQTPNLISQTCSAIGLNGREAWESKNIFYTKWLNLVDS